MRSKAPISDMPDPRRVDDDIAVPDHDLMTADEVADYFRVSTGFVYKLARQKRIPVIHLGRSVRFNLVEVEKALSGLSRLSR